MEGTVCTKNNFRAMVNAPYISATPTQLKKNKDTYMFQSAFCIKRAHIKPAAINPL